MDTHQAEYRTDIARLAEDMAKRESAQADRIAMVTDRMASSRWWRTAILSGAIVAAAGMVTAIIPAAIP